MEMMGIGFILGVLTAIIFVGIGVCFDGIGKRDPEGELDGDSDIRVYVPVRFRDRSRDNGVVKRLDNEEVIHVLSYYRMGATQHERQAFDQLIDDLQKGDTDGRQMEQE